MLQILKKSCFKTLSFLSNSRFSAQSAQANLINELRQKKNSLQTVKKTGLFYEVLPSHISLNPLQEQRYHRKDGKILLFENSFRENLVQKALEILEKENMVYITGARGLGKSHFVSLITCHLSGKIAINGRKILPEASPASKLLDPSKVRVIYINNPEFYYKATFAKAVLPDLVSFLANDFNEKADGIDLTNFYDCDFSDEAKVTRLLKEMIKKLELKGIIVVFVMDQWNIVDQFPNKAVSKFFEDLRGFAKYQIISASNTNESMNRWKVPSQTISILSKRVFVNEEEFRAYGKHLGYFRQDFWENPETFKRIVELTNFNPYELMILHQIFNGFDWKNEEDFESVWEKFEKSYFNIKAMEIDQSHTNFLRQYCASQKSESNFKELVVTCMDTGMIYENMQFYLPLVNYGLMEVDEQLRVSSLCPAINRYYQEHYELTKLSIGEMDKFRKSLLSEYNKTKLGIIFQRLVVLWFLNEKTTQIKGITYSYSSNPLKRDFSIKFDLEEKTSGKFISLYHLDQPRILPEIFLKGNNELVIIGDPNYDLMDYISFRLKDTKSILIYKN